MAASDQLVWQILKGHNSFVRKGLNGMVLSAEPGNLYNKHSYKYSGLANSKTVGIAPAADNAVTVTVARPKNASKPRTSRNSTTSKKRVQRQAPAVAKLVGSVRPDLQKAARARVTAIAKGHRSTAAQSRGQ